MIYNFKSFLRLLEAVTWENTKDTTYGKVTSKDGVVITEDIFKLFLQADPTDGKFFRFISKLYKSMTFEEFEGSLDKIKSLLSDFNTWKHKLNGSQKDIMTYSNLEDLDKVISQYRGNEKIINKSKTLNDLKNDYSIIYKDSEWTVYHPRNKYASNYLGGKYKWCTTSDPKSNRNQFDNYNYSGPFFIIENNIDPTKSVAYLKIITNDRNNSIKNDSMTDYQDKELNIDKFFQKNQEMYGVLIKFIDSVKDEYYSEIPNILEHIKHGHFVDAYELYMKNVEKISKNSKSFSIILSELANVYGSKNVPILNKFRIDIINTVKVIDRNLYNSIISTGYEKLELSEEVIDSILDINSINFLKLYFNNIELFKKIYGSDSYSNAENIFEIFDKNDILKNMREVFQSFSIMNSKVYIKIFGIILSYVNKNKDFKFLDDCISIIRKSIMPDDELGKSLIYSEFMEFILEFKVDLKIFQTVIKYGYEVNVIDYDYLITKIVDSYYFENNQSSIIFEYMKWFMESGYFEKKFDKNAPYCKQSDIFFKNEDDRFLDLFKLNPNDIDIKNQYLSLSIKIIFHIDDFKKDMKEKINILKNLNSFCIRNLDESDILSKFGISEIFLKEISLRFYSIGVRNEEKYFEFYEILEELGFNKDSRCIEYFLKNGYLNLYTGYINAVFPQNKFINDVYNVNGEKYSYGAFMIHTLDKSERYEDISNDIYDFIKLSKDLGVNFNTSKSGVKSAMELYLEGDIKPNTSKQLKYVLDIV